MSQHQKHEFVLIIIIIIITNRHFKMLSYQIKTVTKAREVTTPKQSGTKQFSAIV